MEPIVLQDYVPISRCLDYDLGQLAFQRRGVQAFTTHEVPNLINQGGLVAYRAAEVLFASCQEASEAGTLEDEIACLELGMGIGLHALQLLDRFKALCERESRSYYDRLTFYATDFAPKMLQDATTNCVFERHAAHVVLARADALDPRRVERQDGREVDLTGRLRAVFASYVYCLLPTDHYYRVERGFGPDRAPSWYAVLARTVVRRVEHLAKLTPFTAEQLCELARGGPADLERLVALFPLFDLDIKHQEVPAAEHPDRDLHERLAGYIRRGLAAAGRPSDVPVWLFHSRGAMQSIEAALGALRPDGFLLMRDYGPVTVADANSDRLYQHYGSTTAHGVNHFLIQEWLHDPTDLGRPRATVSATDGDEKTIIKTRLIAAGPIEATRAAFRRAFAQADFEALTETVERARKSAQEAPEKAIALYREALAVEPDNWHLLGEMAAFLCDRKQYDEAQEHALRALAINPWFAAYCWAVLGEIHRQRGDLQRARECLETAVHCNPEESIAYLGLCDIYSAARDYENAAVMASMALAVDHDAERTARATAALTQNVEKLLEQRRILVTLRTSRRAGTRS